MHEASQHLASSFLTLTYDDKHLPRHGGLVVEDFQRFMKRLRKTQADKLRYYMVGEYGEKNLRPHFHVLLFGENFDSDRVLYRRSGPHPYWTSPRLDRVWGAGHAIVANLTVESAAYCTRYCVSKRTGVHASEVCTCDRCQGQMAHYDRLDSRTGEVWSVRPEFNTMSRRPGIGAGWFDKYGSDVFPSDEVRLMGKRFKPPRFYDGRFEEQAPGEMEEIRKARLDRAAKFADELTPERLAVRETVAKARNNLNSRSNA